MSDQHRDHWSVAAGSAFAGLMVLCCAGPALLAAGALGALGAVLANPVVIAIGVLLAAVAVLWAFRRRRRLARTGGHNCCPPRSGSEHPSLHAKH
ncbi:hypothetical protein [Pseudonocardia nigra]|uniref:hypothetical protein n=1 Tax=Pseudonocardia nigra TaxID=1921578 RepID=UPI001C5E1D57|nr:hypothetical protein [Pseudonocardia nigra]